MMGNEEASCMGATTGVRLVMRDAMKVLMDGSGEYRSVGKEPAARKCDAIRKRQPVRGGELWLLDFEVEEYLEFEVAARVRERSARESRTETRRLCDEFT